MNTTHPKGLKEEMERKAKRGEIPGVSKFAIFDEDGNLFLDMN